MTSERFGPYELRDLVGRGSMGEVYRAHDTVRQRTVALKRLPADVGRDGRFSARFRRESELVARLREPHVIPIHDFGEIEGRLYIDMRLVEGVDLATLIQRDGPLAPEHAVDLLAQVASALDAAHREGLVHRDVKPSNVLIDRSGGQDFVYLIDFGVARDGDGAKLTASGALVGTAAYMAPERFSGGGDHRVDVYAAGCLLHEMLTGQQAFPGDLPAQIYAHLHRPPPRPSENGTPVPAALDAVVAQAMAKDPAERFASAGELAAAALRGLSPAAPPPAVPPALRPSVPHTVPPTRADPPVHPPGAYAAAVRLNLDSVTRPVPLSTRGRARHRLERGRSRVPLVVGVVVALLVAAVVVLLVVRGGL